MSISSINTSKQTGLVPQSLLGYTSNGKNAIEINSTDIILGANLTTTPVYIGISSTNGLTTTRAGGLNINCDFDMNNKRIYDLNSIRYAPTYFNISQSSGAGFDISTGFHTSGYTNTGNGTNTIYFNAGNNGGGLLIDNQFNSQMSFTNGIRIADTWNTIVGSSTGLAVTGLITGTITNATNSTNATNVNTTLDTTTATSCPIAFYTGSSGNQATLVNTGLNFVPSTNTLTVTNLTGNASTATTATNSTNVNTTLDTTTATSCPIAFYTGSSGNQATLVNTGLNFQPSTTTLTCANITGTCSNANAINTTSDNTNTTCYIPFVKGTAGTGKTVFIDDTTNTMTYNPSTSTFACSNLVVTQINTPLIFVSTSLQLPTGTGTATFSGTTLTITSSTSNTFRNYNVGITGTTNTIATCSFSSFPVNGLTYVNIYNGGTGNLTINSTGLGVKTTFTSPIIVPTLGYCILRINYLNFTTGGNIFVLSVELVA